MNYEIFNPVRLLIANKQLGDALHMMRSQMASNQLFSLSTELEAIESDYTLMLNYFGQGFEDSQRNQLFFKLLRKAWRCVNNADLAFHIKNCTAFGYAATKGDKYRGDNETIKKKVEDFTSDLAINELMGEAGKQQEAKIYEEHHDFITALFGMLLTERQWNEETRCFFAHLILSSNTHINDALVLTSAIQLSIHNFFDPQKWLTLIEIYQKAHDDRLRQRALVGWALTKIMVTDLFPEVTDKLKEMAFDEQAHQQLTELQMQIYFCMDAENDHEEIQREIMPNIIKNNGFNITPFGITEKEDDPMQDILNPHAGEEAMEEMERNYQKMMEMQKAGSDIYFGGFAQMKRFAFFQTVSNWFSPFYIQHPDIKISVEKMKDSKFMQVLFDHGPFCDSDKYSFALAMKTVIDRLPDNLKEMLDNQEALGPTMSDEEKQTSAYIRRMYLQDLYRFHKLYSDKNAFRNPFSTEKEFNKTDELFLGDNAFRGILHEDEVISLAKFLLKRKRYRAMQQLLAVHSNSVSPQHALLKAWAYYHNHEYDKAKESFYTVLDARPDVESARQGLAKTLVRLNHYGEAAEHYQLLVEAKPNSKSYRLNLALCLIQENRYEEAIKHAFQLKYEHPDDNNVRRLLAWCLMHNEKKEQALQEYETLTSAADVVKDDFLNAGYCQWITGHVAQALESFLKFVGLVPNNKGLSLLQEEFNKEMLLLSSNGIDECQRVMMLDAVKNVKK
ncbi:MAG: tetratricopeptide repeat protein [Prevotella sp.]|nr:tetratricopeptide repeat protein [Prevotella sp.]